MQIDFSKVQLKDIEGKTIEVDISKELGNMMYLQAQDIAVADLGRDIYHNKVVELNAAQANMVKAFVKKGFSAVLQRDLIPLLQ